MPARAVPSPPHLSLVCCALVDGALAVLLADEGSSRRLPTGAMPGRGSVEAAADAGLRRLLGRPVTWLAQAGVAVEDGLRVVVAAIVPVGTPAPEGMSWVPTARVAAVAGQAAATDVRAAVTAMRDALDRAPVAFRLLGPSFTLSDLQQVYELLLERRLHKASFRRSLLAAHLVEPTDTWKSEGRGRPAQLFRFSPRRRRGLQRPVRFELLG